eukprot:Em0016g820a
MSCPHDTPEENYRTLRQMQNLFYGIPVMIPLSSSQSTDTANGPSSSRSTNTASSPSTENATSSTMNYRWSSPPFRDPHRIKRVRSELNQSLKTKMYRVPGPNHGVYCSLTERLREELEVIIPLDPDFNHEVFRIKLSGDGAKFSRCSNFFLVSFAILNLEQRVLSPRDNHTVAVLKMPECHDILATTLEPLLQEIKLLMESQIIEVEGSNELHWFLRVMDVLLENVVLQVVQLDVKVNKKQADPIQGAMLQKLVESIQDFEELHTNISSWTPDSDVIESKVKYPINKLQQCLQLHYLSIKAKQWIKDFVALSPVAQGYQKDRVTPYMHIMAMHMPHMIRLHGNIKQFSCQGVEKLNDIAKRSYHSSCKRDPAMQWK